MEPPLDELPIAPSVEEWRALSPADRLSFLETVFDALSDPRRVMSEGQQHKKAKSRALDMLTLHFGATGRVIYLAEELTVLYPGERTFSPDVLAVVDVPQPEDDQRLAWVVADESRGLDLALEVLHHGDRKKDLVKNVERYAQLGIPEYFVYDRMRQQVHGYRLTEPGARRYQRIVPQFGRHHSTVLGLDLVVESGRLQFYYGMSELFGSDDLIRRLKGMVENLEIKADQNQAQAEQALAQAEQARVQAEQAVITTLRQALLAFVEARFTPLPDDVRARLLAEGDPSTLQRWLLRAATVGTPDEIFSA